MVAQHNSKATNKLFKDLKKKGFTISDKSKKGTIKITPPSHISGGCYYTHGNESSYHPLCRDIKKLYGIDVK